MDLGRRVVDSTGPRRVKYFYPEVKYFCVRPCNNNDCGRCGDNKIIAQVLAAELDRAEVAVVPRPAEFNISRVARDPR